MFPPSPDNKYGIAIVGGGVTGLTAAWKLHAQGHRVTVFEQSDRLGGAISTMHRDGWLVEHGPNSLMESTPLDVLLTELGLQAERQYATPAAKNRYLVRDGRLVPVRWAAPAGFDPVVFRCAPSCGSSPSRLPAPGSARPT